jgi:hypothetical protein
LLLLVVGILYIFWIWMPHQIHGLQKMSPLHSLPCTLLIVFIVVQKFLWGFLLVVLFCFILWARVSLCSLCWPWILSILLPQPPKWWDYRHVSPCPSHKFSNLL